MSISAILSPTRPIVVVICCGGVPRPYPIYKDGHPRHSKDILAQRISERWYNTPIFSFMYPLKKIAVDAFGAFDHDIHTINTLDARIENGCDVLLSGRERLMLFTLLAITVVAALSGAWMPPICIIFIAFLYCDRKYRRTARDVVAALADSLCEHLYRDILSDVVMNTIDGFITFGYRRVIVNDCCFAHELRALHASDKYDIHLVCVQAGDTPAHPRYTDRDTADNIHPWLSTFASANVPADIAADSSSLICSLANELGVPVHVIDNYGTLDDFCEQADRLADSIA